MKTVLIYGDSSDVLSVTLADMIEFISHSSIQLDYWVIKRFEAITNSSFAYSDVRIFEQLVVDSIFGLLFTYEQICNLSDGVEQGINFTILGFTKSLRLQVDDSGSVIFNPIEMKFELIDSSYWEVSASNVETVAEMLAFFKSQGAELMTSSLID